MKSNFADALESYMIPAIEAENSSWSRKEKLQAAAIGVGAIAGAAYLIRDAKKSKERAKQQEEDRKKREEEAKRKKEAEEKEYNKRYHFKFDDKKALPDSNIIYPENKFKNTKELISSLERDLKIALQKLLSSHEINEAFNVLCKDYNNTPNGEERDKRFDFDGPAKLSTSWLKSKFSVELFEKGKDDVTFSICRYDQDFTLFLGMELVYVLGDYIENMYKNCINSIRYGDGDEGCLYIEF